MWAWQKQGRNRTLQSAWESLQRPSERRSPKRKRSPGTQLRIETLEPRLALTGVVLNEILASSSGAYLQDEDGDDSDFIELYNSGDTAVDLGGWYLTDEDDELTKWQLPSVELAAGDYLIVFASSKNRAVAGSELHSNFGLSADGEDVFLVRPDGTTIESGFEFPEQYVDASYGWADIYEDDILIGQELRYFITPTPGQANGEGVVGFVAPVELSHEHGFYEDEFYLELETDTEGAQIYFTYDGSIPSPDNSAAQLYAEPILINRTTVFRAAAHSDGLGNSRTATQTYIFLEDVITQTIDPLNPANNPFGLAYPQFLQPGYPADYNMDPSIVSTWDDLNPENDDFGIREALLSLPTMSIVMDHDDLWDAVNGIYPNALQQGDEWRRPSSVEYFDPSGERSSFQENVGVVIHGNSSRNPNQPKHNFRLIFNPEFDGPGRLDYPLFDQSDFADINTVVLKGMNQDSFSVRTSPNRMSSLTSTYMRDQWALNTSRAMGHVAPEFTYVHLYVNGLYFGLYEAAERMDDASLSSRLGGNPEDWDVVQPFLHEFEGSLDTWNAMFTLARQIPSNSPTTANAIYFQLQGLNPDGTRNESMPVYLDMDNLIDHLLLHYFTGAAEWLSNAVAARNRVDPGSGFKFYVWDQDVGLNANVGYWGRISDTAGGTSTSQELKTRLQRSPEFRLRFADRAQMHLYNGGALSIEQGAERWQELADHIEPSIVADSARWGDAKAELRVRLVNGGPVVTLPTITIDHWRDSVEAVHAYIVESHSRIDDLLINNGNLFTTLRPPLLNQFGGMVDAGFELELNQPEGTPGTAKIYYTLDGSDPRLLGGGLNPAALEYNGSITLEDTLRIRTRMLNGTTWSAIVDTTIGVLANEPPENFLAGDYDGNGTVEPVDYLIWKQGYGQTVEHYAGADGNGDGIVDAADYTVWRNNLGATNQTEPEYSFNVIGQTYTQNFNAFRGSEETLPNHFTVAVDEGDDIFRGTFNSTTDAAASFTGIKAATNDGSDYSFVWRESTGAAGLVDTRVLFAFTNNTGEAIVGFDVSYDVESWVNGRRDNQVRFKYDVYADSDDSQAAEGRDAFESDIFATLNEHHMPIDNNNQQSVLNGKANRTAVSGYVDLTTLLLNETNPGLGVFGALMPGQTAYFRWQISNGLLTDGNRSALGIDNLSIAVLATAPATGGGGLAIFSEDENGDSGAASLAARPAAVPLERSAALDLALTDWARTAPAPATASSRLLSPQAPLTSASLDNLLIVALGGSDARHSLATDALCDDLGGEDTDDRETLFAELAMGATFSMLGDG